MTVARESTELGTPPEITTPGALGEHEAPIACAAPAGPGPFLLEGDRVAILGTERRGVEKILMDGRRVAAHLVTDLGNPANVVVAPGTLRRELVGPGVSVLESTLALPALPLLATQWRRVGGTGVGRPFTVEVVLQPETRAVRWASGAAGVRTAGEDDDRVVDFLVHPAPNGWTVEPCDDGGVRVRATVDADGPVTALVAAGTPDRVERALAGVPHLASHEIRAAAAADPGKMHTLVVRTGVREIDEATAWASARVQATLRRPGTAAPEDLFWTGVGALAIGDRESAARAVQALEGAGAPAVMLTARYALATGDQDAAAALFGALEPESLDALRAQGPAVWGPWQDALARLADALLDAVVDAELGGLRRFAAQPAAHAGKTVRLPMSGAETPPNATWPGRLLGGPPGPVASGLPPETLRTWADVMGPEVERGWTAWRQSVAAGLTGGPAGRGSWDPAPVTWGAAAPHTGILLGCLAHGLLGIEPDAPSGRLGLAPRLPRHVTTFSAGGVRVGDASMTLRYQRDGSVHRFELEPRGGRIPVMAIFEPSVPVQDVAEVRVDGAVAKLDLTREGARTVVPVQLPLDATRSLEVIEG